MVCGDDRYGANGHMHLRLVTRSDDHSAGVHDEIHIFLDSLVCAGVVELMNDK